MALLPLATGAAVLRNRLYDLDRVISRTLAYRLLTVLLGLGYAVVVLGLGRLPGRDSSLIVAAATLAVAAAFHTGELLTVVDQTVQPTQTSLWLRHNEPNPTGGAAARQLDR